MKANFTRVVLWEQRRTDKAVLFTTLPDGDPDAREVWIPLSQIDHISKNPSGECLVDIADWLVEKNEL